MSARKPGRSVFLGSLGAAIGAITVLASNGTIQLTAQDKPRGNLDQLLGGLGSTPTPSAPTADAGATKSNDTTSTQGATTDSSSQATPAATHRPTPKPTPHTISGTFTGDVSWSNPYGPIQVQITVSHSKITDAQLVQMPQDFTSSRISTEAASYLRDEVISAQSANINYISGASLTSPAYVESLTSAIARAGI